MVNVMESLVLYNGLPQCRHCGKPLRGRSDKLYCDISCKNAFHNQEQKNDLRAIEQIDRILRHNRKVLKAVLGDRPKAKVSRTALIRQGFDFKYYTHHQRGSNNIELTCCYDFGYLHLDQEKTLVVRITTPLYSHE
jgi:hypothetical protein